MRCENCPQYSSEPLWNRCEITGAECFNTINNCDLVNEDGSDNGKFDEIVTFVNHLSTVAYESENE